MRQLLGLLACSLIGFIVPAAASADISRADSTAICADGTVTAKIVFHDLDASHQPITGSVSLSGFDGGVTQRIDAFTYPGATGTLFVSLPITDDAVHYVVGVFDWPGRAPGDRRAFSVGVGPDCLSGPPPPKPKPVTARAARAAVLRLLSHPSRWSSFRLYEAEPTRVVLEGHKLRTGTYRWFTVTRAAGGLLRVDPSRSPPPA